MPEPTSTPHDMETVRIRLQKGDERMNRIEEMLTKNTKDTTEVLEILQLGRSFFRLAGYFGAFVKWATPIGAACWSVYQIFKNGGKS